MKKRDLNLLPVTDVEPIVEEYHRKNLATILMMSGVTKPINYWD